MFDTELTTENQQIFLKQLQDSDVELWMKREDKIHPYVSGNKFRKLKYNILEAKRSQKETIVTFGGAYSNHIVATAVAGNLSNIKTVGIIRGQELADNFNKVLKENNTLHVAYTNGMQFEFITREAYRNKNEESFINKLKEKYGDFYLIPEGGTNSLAVKGCEEILSSEDQKFDYICTAVGTGGTIAGLINAANENQKIIGFPALKGDFLKDEIIKFTKSNHWSLNTNYHFGGYGKFNKELIEFINQFKLETQIPLDPIYTGKMLYGIVDMMLKKQFKKGSKILIIHTGGLQGIDGFNKRLKKKNIDLIKV
ncbi:1-aminocyclopropane-1-carboxylate deaminase/D-cysteine desulfhydrase [Tenacibaculum jejuense]|uniref:D-cysteine desulfhydrase family protein n=1 Tax=Tenacibaculum jejuense TaxID=584609 RepID=A0A238UDE1_9FLAO|nr:pyridoxal-phosphate dependent enzyme [Tenacibaculum jejuense]SNR17189.1 D-cysteine desulfhydrase family protein [Tenacibaculum jejuense]